MLTTKYFQTTHVKKKKEITKYSIENINNEKWASYDMSFSIQGFKIIIYYNIPPLHDKLKSMTVFSVTAYTKSVLTTTKRVKINFA